MLRFCYCSPIIYHWTGNDYYRKMYSMYGNFTVLISEIIQELLLWRW
jgi:hypothetical protein